MFTFKCANCFNCTPVKYLTAINSIDLTFTQLIILGCHKHFASKWILERNCLYVTLNTRTTKCHRKVHSHWRAVEMFDSVFGRFIKASGRKQLVFTKVPTRKVRFPFRPQCGSVGSFFNGRWTRVNPLLRFSVLLPLLNVVCRGENLHTV